MDLNPFHYKLAEVRKFALAAVVSIITLVGYFIVFEPGFEAAAVAVVAALFNMIAVFADKNATVDDYSKGVDALLGSVLGLTALFTTVDPNTAETIFAIAAAIVNVVGVVYLRNRTPGAPPDVAPTTAAPRRARAT